MKKSGAHPRPKRAHPRQNNVGLFSHLPAYSRESSITTNVSFSSRESVHPDVLRVGLKFADGAIVGASARAVAMLSALKSFLFSDSVHAKTAGEIERQLRPQIEFLFQCRPHSLTMGNAIRHIKVILGRLPPTMPAEKACGLLAAAIDRFVDERIDVHDAVCTHLLDEGRKIVDGDVILTYSHSPLVERILVRAHESGISFRVVVVDSRPRLAGRPLLAELRRHGCRCTYVLLNGLGHVMKTVTKCLLGASGLMSNGAVVSRVGTALVAAVASAVHRPVIVCAETYKFCEGVQLDSICSNELGDPDAIFREAPASHREVLEEWRDIPSLRLLNLEYDVTPQQHISVVATEVGLVPPTSVPVIVREFRRDAEST